MNLSLYQKASLIFVQLNQFTMNFERGHFLGNPWVAAGKAGYSQRPFLEVARADRNGVGSVLRRVDDVSLLCTAAAQASYTRDTTASCLPN